MNTFCKNFLRNALLASLTVILIHGPLNKSGAAPQAAPGGNQPALSGIATAPPQSTGEVSALPAPALKGTAAAEEISAVPKGGALTYQAPAGAQSSMEVSIEKLTLKAEELPESINMASTAKMKTNPHMATSQNDFTKIAKEAFKNRVQFNNWRVVHTSFYANREGQDDTLYILISIEYKKEMNPEIFKKDISAIKQYLKKETSDEYVLLENFPFVSVVAANQMGDYEFAIVKELGDRLKVKLFGVTPVAPVPVVYDAPKTQPEAAAQNGTAEVSTPAPQAGNPPADPGKAQPAMVETVKTEVIHEETIKEDSKAPASTTEVKIKSAKTTAPDAKLENTPVKPVEKDTVKKTTADEKKAATL